MRSKLIMWLGLTSALFLSTNVALAQGSGLLEEVIVTAQHRAENIQDVPIAVTALGEDALKKSDLFDVATISQHVPGVAYP